MEGNHFCAVDGGVLMVRVIELPQAAVGDDCLGLVYYLIFPVTWSFMIMNA